MLKTGSPDPAVKTRIDALLLKLPGVEGGDMTGMPAYFVKGKMFACIHGKGVAIRLPAASATELQFSSAHVTPFQPNNRPSSREWIQLNREDPADYDKDLDLIKTSIEFVKTGK